MARNVLESLRLLIRSAQNFVDRCIACVTADAEGSRELVEKDLASATALAPAIGYDTAAKLAKQAMDQDRPLREVVAEAGVLSDDELDRRLDLKRMTQGDVLGD